MSAADLCNATFLVGLSLVALGFRRGNPAFYGGITLMAAVTLIVAVAAIRDAGHPDAHVYHSTTGSDLGEGAHHGKDPDE